MERFSLKKLNEVEGKEQYHIEVSNMFAAVKDLNAFEIYVFNNWRLCQCAWSVCIVVNCVFCYS
jgi:hypothetical protein